MHVGTAPLSTPYIWAEWAKKFPNIDFLFTHIGYYEFGMSTIMAVKDLKMYGLKHLVKWMLMF